MQDDDDIAPAAPDDAPDDELAADPADSAAAEPDEAETETPAAREALRFGTAVIADMVKLLPNGPGVYRMLSGSGDVLYVGKARSLKKRVSSYARIAGQSNRIIRMIQATAAMEFVTTATETEALLLEANLIKQLRPRFNVLLRDDKSFPYILITGDHEAPQLVKHRGARSRKGRYFGPFASAGAVTRTINAMQKAFLIRTCTDSVYETRTRPCLLHQIKRCSAPCTREIAIPDYAELVSEATAFLSGKSRAIRSELAAEMQTASEAMEFERAAVYRDRLAALSHVQSHQGINPQNVEEADVFACHQDGGQTSIQVFFFRTGQNWGNRAYFPRADKSMEVGEVLSSFIGQFYDDKPAPRLVLVSHEPDEMDLLAAALSERAGHRIEIAVPRRGEKKDLVDHALQNAREALGRKLAETSSQSTLLGGVARAFGLEAPPRRIEVYDNSHISGSNAVGGMIVAGPEGFVKNQYRKFNIRGADITPGDDFGMMREVLTRRFSRLIKEHGPRGEAVAPEAGTVAGEEGPLPTDPVGPWPDLVLIDGGAGQLSAAQAIFDELGIDDVALVGVAKGPDRDAGREKFFVTGKPDFMLPLRDPVLYYVQRLRDEAHRFAIGSHRARRSKDIGRAGLEEIAGVGPTRKRALLNHFGTLKAIQRAGIEDLLSVPGISEATARTVYEFFHEKAE
ncbi:excinuclease ABC subunit UvrC [Methylobrevis albus]|uniref:UvrABC system protein C n=1 Tax=Methylobrevis albus TaxID=2793297 RepID=A0A931I3B7_9HYPH|nr:excinuclease ABC subunit UvrC [Methylobrevis albus]MBH0238505.1 excinuclease ABC subunit UvrC [Methylobrevis albus]